MKELVDRIKQDGEVLPGNVLKINSFLNHQVDPQLMMHVGEEFARLFKDEKVDKVLTCEASGIAPGVMAAYQLHVPMIFARKKKPSTLNDAVYWADVFSYTKKVNNKICVEEKFLHPGEHILTMPLTSLPTVKQSKAWLTLLNKPAATLLELVLLLQKPSKAEANG